MKVVNPIFLIILVALMGCSGSDSNSSTSTNNSNLKGYWLNNCATTTSAVSGVYETFIWDFKNDEVNVEYSLYTDASCNNQVLSIIVNMDYSVQSKVEQNGSIVPINYVVNSAMLNVKDDNYITTFNTNSACGFTDWVLNTPKDVSGIDCSATLGFSLPASSTQLFNIVSRRVGDISFGNDTSPLGEDLEVNRPSSIYPIYYLPLATSDLAADGAWSRTCIDESLERWVFNGSDVNFTFSKYLNIDCTGLLFNIVADFNNFNQGNRVVSFPFVREIEYTQQSVILTIVDATTVTTFNNMSGGSGACGFNDWVINVPKSIAGADCSNLFGGPVVFQSDSTIFYSIIKIENDKYSTADGAPEIFGAVNILNRPFNINSSLEYIKE